MIRNTSLILVLMGLLVNSSDAQKLQYGLSIGLSRANLKESIGTIHREEEYSSLCGGIVIEYSLSKTLAVHSGVLYSSKGVDGTLSSYGPLLVITPLHLRTDYLELPIVLKYSFFQSIYLGIGSYYSRKIAGKLKLDGHESNLIKPEEVGYILEAGLNFKLHNKKHFIEVRLSRGITPVFSIAGDYKYRNISLAVLYGLYF